MLFRIPESAQDHVKSTEYVYEKCEVQLLETSLFCNSLRSCCEGTKSHPFQRHNKTRSGTSALPYLPHSLCFDIYCIHSTEHLCHRKLDLKRVFWLQEFSSSNFHSIHRISTRRKENGLCHVGVVLSRASSSLDWRRSQ